MTFRFIWKEEARLEEHIRSDAARKLLKTRRDEAERQRANRTKLLRTSKALGWSILVFLVLYFGGGHIIGYW